MIITIGRGHKNDYVLENGTVSRRHATLEISEGNIILRDVGSSAGTFVEMSGVWERTTYTVVNENQHITLGNEIVSVKEIIEHMAKRNREAVYERNPLTGEIVKK